MKYGSAMIKSDTWYSIRYEFTVENIAEDGSVKYNVKAFINNKVTAVNQTITSRAGVTEAPCLLLVIYDSLTVDNMTLDFDSFSFSLE